ncbi:hypothetical protein [Ahrensia kielensis]|uniref:hypothetical protein n=1 Tax=Ahrensia kielensis TaxID=76980 RepID=UPI00035DE0FB|nr:hypothetical protein [Ahrensia kielensis]
MTSNLVLFGTEQTPVVGRSFMVWPWSFTFENGALRHIRLNGAEAIRGIAFLVRNRDWGTLIPQIDNEEITQENGALHVRYDAIFSSNNARLSVAITIEANDGKLTMAARGHATGSFETNRAGFTVLHPITDVAGYPVHVDHSDGSHEDANFPLLIEPWQPFMDISGLTHQVGDALVACELRGDTFEMEDQRQWGDASFKTYNRPLAKPWPYEIGDGETLEQSVNLSWAPSKADALISAQPFEDRVNFPQMALVMTPEDALRLADNPADITYVNPQRLLCHLDATLGETEAQFKAFARAQSACSDIAFDLELICRCETDPAPEMNMLADQMKKAGFTPSSILICPAVDRQSTPPGSQWPECPPLDLVHKAAARSFPNIARGGGMVSFFPELNRKRPPVAMLDFVSHGLCPIVHAADDLSVMETLEAIPHITRSMRSIIGDKAYRIGPATIAMRQNPYGNRTIPNPDNERICMAHDDPRHRAQFGAAYVIGLAAALAPAGVSVWTPAALYGPRGVVADQGLWPIAEILKQLAAFAGQPVHKAEIADGTARLWVGEVVLSANLTGHATAKLGPYQWCAEP